MVDVNQRKDAEKPKITPFGVVGQIAGLAKSAVFVPANVISKITVGELPLVTIAKWAVILLIILGIAHIAIDVIVRPMVMFASSLIDTVQSMSFLGVSFNGATTGENAPLAINGLEVGLFLVLWYIRCFIYICVAVLTFIFMWTWIFKGLNFLVRSNNLIEKFVDWVYRDGTEGQIPEVKV